MIPTVTDTTTAAKIAGSGIFRVHLHGVHDDILCHGRVEAHLTHRALELPAGKGVAGERHRRARLDPTDIHLVHPDPDLHLRQIFRNEKQAGRIEARHRRLPDVHPPVVTNTAPVFQNLVRSGNAIILNWSAVTGQTNQLQYKTNLNQPNWINLGTTITATGATLSATNSIGPDPQRFYRVIVGQ